MAETLRNTAWVAENERLNAEMQRRRFRVVVIVEECVAGDGEDSGDWEENPDLAEFLNDNYLNALIFSINLPVLS